MQEVQKSYLIRGNTGGGDRTRTGGLYVANVALFQLSYTPNNISPTIHLQSYTSNSTVAFLHHLCATKAPGFSRRGSQQPFLLDGTSLQDT